MWGALRPQAHRSSLVFKAKLNRCSKLLPGSNALQLVSTAATTAAATVHSIAHWLHGNAMTLKPSSW
jgi:hypothetical protein